MTEKRTAGRGLGRGLSALMADLAPTRDDAAEATAGPIATVPVELVHPNADQPRRSFDQAALDELAASIRDRGILQPLIVRPNPDGPGYQIVAGERRWRAAQAAQLHEVPVIVRDYSDQDVLEVSIIENIQRTDLNPVDEALAYRTLAERFGHTQEKIAEALGKSRSHVANATRLLQLPETVLAMLRDGRLTAGHARALVTIADPGPIAALAVAQNLTVREVEEIARRKRPRRPRAGSQPADKDADTAAIESDLSAALGMAVQIRVGSDGGGTLSVSYKSLDDLDRLCETLSRAGRRGAL